MLSDGTPNRLINENSPYLVQHAHNRSGMVLLGGRSFCQSQSGGQGGVLIYRVFGLPLVPYF